MPLLFEYEAVMTRPEHLAAWRLSREDIGELLDALAEVAEPVSLSFLWRPVLRDPDDDMVLETAVKGRADAIGTFNKRDFGQDAVRFGIAVLTSGEALGRFGGQI